MLIHIKDSVMLKLGVSFFCGRTVAFVTRTLLFQVPKPPPYTSQLSLKRKQQQQAQQAQVEKKKLLAVTIQ